jgi:rod shape-determining protein MreC
MMAPFRSAAQRFATAAFVALSVATLVLGRADGALIERARMATADVMAPVLALLARPGAVVADGVGKVRELAFLYRENERLRAENAALLQWQQVARRLDGENAELKGLLAYQPEATTWFVSARVIGTAGGAFSRTVLVDRGSQDSVAKGQAAASGSGLVGRVAEVGLRTARVLLLTDVNSRIPVVLADTHARAILAGDNTDRPQLVYLPPGTVPRPGERVVTSGDGGVFPPGLPVGVVASLEGGAARLAPAADLARVDYLRLVDFGLGGVLPPGAVPAPKAPRGGQAEAAGRP